MTCKGEAAASQETEPHEEPSEARSEAGSSRNGKPQAAQRKPQSPKGGSANHNQNGPEARDARQGQYTPQRNA